MLNVLVLILTAALLIAIALIFFIVGFTVAGCMIIKSLRNKGWTIEPPEEVVVDAKPE